MKIKTVWPGGYVEIPDPPPVEELPYRVVTTEMSCGDANPDVKKQWGKWVKK
jgi:hypothetical protein